MNRSPLTEAGVRATSESVALGLPSERMALLAEAFNQMAKDIQQYMEHIAALTAREEKEKAEMAVARQIQLGMMPDSRNFLPEEVSFRLHAMTEPARQVGGDFFDFFQITIFCQ